MSNIHQQTFQEYLANVVGTPYNNMDCYQLTADFYRSLLNIDLNNLEYEQPVKQEAINNLFNLEKSKFKRVYEKEIGDIIVIRVFGMAAHIGVYIGENKMLHTTSKTDCVIERLDKFSKRILGFYRWPSLDTA